MELKVKDFAAQQGVSDSIIYRHIRNHREQLGDSVVKKSKATWLTDEAQDYLRNLMVQQPIVVNEGAAPFLNQIEQLQNRIQLLEERIERKDVLIEKLQQREAAKDKLLEKAAEKQKFLDTATQKVAELERQVDQEKKEKEQALADAASFSKVFGSVYVKKK